MRKLSFKLSADCGGAADSPEIKRVIDRVARELTKERAAFQSRLRASRESIKALRKIHRRVKRLPPEKLREVSCVAGLAYAYNKRRKACRRAQHDPTDANLHEWRKQTKYLFGETDVLLRLGHARVAVLHRQASLLATTLGEDHDWAMVQPRMVNLHLLDRSRKTGEPIKILLRRIERSRADLRRKALRLAEKCFRVRPRLFRVEFEWRLRRPS